MIALEKFAKSWWGVIILMVIIIIVRVLLSRLHGLSTRLIDGHLF